MDFSVESAWSWLGYIIHDYATQLINWANGTGSFIRGSY